MSGSGCLFSVWVGEGMEVAGSEGVSGVTENEFVDLLSASFDQNDSGGSVSTVVSGSGKNLDFVCDNIWDYGAFIHRNPLLVGFKRGCMVKEVLLKSRKNEGTLLEVGVCEMLIYMPCRCANVWFRNYLSGFVGNCETQI